MWQYRSGAVEHAIAARDTAVAKLRGHTRRRRRQIVVGAGGELETSGYNGQVEVRGHSSSVGYSANSFGTR